MSTATTNSPRLSLSREDEACIEPVADPPPPYPSPQRRTRTLRAHRRPNHHIQTSLHTQTSSTGTQDGEPFLSSYTDEEDGAPVPTDSTQLLPHRHAARPRHYGAAGRARAYSYTSSVSAVPSIAHTVLSFFQGDSEHGLEGEGTDGLLVHQRVASIDDGESLPGVPESRSSPFFSLAAWRRYFGALFVKAYYCSLFHLLVINFPYGLIAWIYLFVFTVTGTTLLVALPLGAVLCFLNLLGARTFSRGELALQYRFHRSASLHHAPYPPRPIFTRYREPTPAEAEDSEANASTSHGALVREKSFYKNTYAMFTDPTSYQALFYFLVIKPAITLLISIGIIAVALPLFVLVLPAPAVLRAVRRIGIWQANVAIEGLYVAVR